MLDQGEARPRAWGAADVGLVALKPASFRHAISFRNRWDRRFGLSVSCIVEPQDRPTTTVSGRGRSWLTQRSFDAIADGIADARLGLLAVRARASAFSGARLYWSAVLNRSGAAAGHPDEHHVASGGQGLRDRLPIPAVSRG